MGVWANGPDPTKVDVAGIAEAMRPTLYAWFTAHVRIYDPRRSQVSGYNPVTDQSATERARTLVLDSGAAGALIQPIRQPTRVEAGGQATGILGIRFQIKRVAPEVDQLLRGGLIVEVVDGGEDVELTHYGFALTETIDSSLAWGRIYDATMMTGAR